MKFHWELSLWVLALCLWQVVDHLDALGRSALSPPILVVTLRGLAPLPPSRLHVMFELFVGLHQGSHQVGQQCSLGDLDVPKPSGLSMHAAHRSLLPKRLTVLSVFFFSMLLELLLDLLLHVDASKVLEWP